MRKIFLIMLALLVLASNAFAYHWAIEPRMFAGPFFPMSESWRDLYEENGMTYGGGGLNAELFYGLGPYFSFAQGGSSNEYEEEIDIKFDMSSVALGVQYRYYIFDWLAPGVFVGGLFNTCHEEISDNEFKYEMEYSGGGFEAGFDLNGYPFAWMDNFARGFGLFFRFLYQSRPLEDMGKLDDASGMGFMFGIQYKFDFGSKPEKAQREPEEVSPRPVEEPVPEPEPVVEPPPEPEPPGPEDR